MKINISERDLTVNDLDDPNISEMQKRESVKLKAQRMIYSRQLRELYTGFCHSNPEINVSMTLYHQCKPFYIFPPSEREKEGCLCIKCLNPHAIYSSVCRHIEGLPMSLSEYLTKNVECEKDMNINFPKLECILGKCKNQCTINNKIKRSYDWNKHTSYYQFEPVVETFYNKEREKNITNVNLRDLYMKLQEKARVYLLHHYHILIDQVYWTRFLADSEFHITWMDYSMNIKMIEKNQVQSAHFSGKQKTLHDTLKRSSNTDDKFLYLYYISDDTNHDSVMTIRIIRDLITYHPYVIEPGNLILRSDNAETQYKSLFVFKSLLNLANEYNIDITWFYGEACHGCGLMIWLQSPNNEA